MDRHCADSSESLRQHSSHTFGYTKARKEGKRFGRPPVLNEEQQQAVIARIKSGASISSVARDFNTSRQTIMRVKVSKAKWEPLFSVDKLNSDIVECISYPVEGSNHLNLNAL